MCNCKYCCILAFFVVYFIAIEKSYNLQKYKGGAKLEASLILKILLTRRMQDIEGRSLAKLIAVFPTWFKIVVLYHIKIAVNNLGVIRGNIHTNRQTEDFLISRGLCLNNKIQQEQLRHPDMQQ